MTECAPCTETPKLDRVDILERAKALTMGERRNDYGSPIDLHWDVALMWTAFLRPKMAPGSTLEPQEVAMMMGMLKMARTRTSPKKRDNYDDMAAYAAIAGECAEIPAEETDLIIEAPR